MDLESKGIVAKTKVQDQPRSHCEADLHLCFHKAKIRFSHHVAHIKSDSSFTGTILNLQFSRNSVRQTDTLTCQTKSGLDQTKILPQRTVSPVIGEKNEPPC